MIVDCFDRYNLRNALAANEESIFREIAELRLEGDRVVAVHGGGPEIDAALALRGLGARRIDGLRVTDAATLEITE
ncbi:MAG: hypothetical protein M3Y21_04270, partial [Candidatus Eremiobacteraeota bacterium]|nr:hypothetical protein [Candidatus Eremiobacteraeota bacterium]